MLIRYIRRVGEISMVDDAIRGGHSGGCWRREMLPENKRVLIFTGEVSCSGSA